MPYESPLSDFLDDLDLKHYHNDFISKLGVTAIDHLTYVQAEDVAQLGMTQPEWRRLRASMKKVKKAKKGGKAATKQPPPLSKVTAPGGQPSGGHIIPASDITILDKELGRGEFGKVMQGVWTNREGNKIQVAVKCLSPEKLSMDKCQQDFLKEAAIMHSLNHESLVKLYGVVLDLDSSLMLVTEFAPLRSLAENIKQEALKPAFPVPLLLDFSIQIAEAMRYLHISNIIHRDLAARNILLFVDDEGQKKAKISDFGLSRRLLLEENYRSEMRPNLKLPLAWMPVESLTKLTFTKSSDVWSFGVTMWEMFSYGRQPWATLSGEEILKTIDKPRLERLERPEACPPKVYDVMIRCWTHEPESRISFGELCDELPKARPMQVKAIVNYVGRHPDELSFKADDLITVLDVNEETGLWRGVNPSGRVGYFQRNDTASLGSNQGGKLRRWRSGRSSKTENRRSILYASQRPKRQSKLTLDDISKPKDYKHIFHVGADGKVEGDPTFGGDYRSLPRSDASSPSKSSSGKDSKSSSPSKSPGKTKKGKKASTSPTIELSKDTILPPPNGFDSGSTVSVPDVVPSVTQVDHSEPLQPPPKIQREPKRAQPEPEFTKPEPELTRTNGNSHAYHKDDLDVVSPLPDNLSLSPAFEMGSLLDDMMSVWDSAKLNLGFSEPLEIREDDDVMAEEEESQNLLEGEANGHCHGNGSLSCSTNRGGSEVVPVVVTEPVFAEAAKTEEAEAPRPPEEVLVGSMSNGGLHANDEALGAVGGASGGVSSKASDGGLLSGNIIIKDSISKPTKTYRKVPRQTASSGSEGDGGGGVTKPEPQQEQVQSRPGREANIARQLSREKRWDSEFKRLSTSPKEKAENDYIDTNNFQQMGGRKSSNEEYEELSLATSPQPYTLRDNVLDSANVSRGPRFGDVSRSVSMRTARPEVDSFGVRAEVELARSRSLREPPVSPLGQQAYDSLIGGEISSNSRFRRYEAQERKAPAVPPKPAPKPAPKPINRSAKSPTVSGSASVDKEPLFALRSADYGARNSEAHVSSSSGYRTYSGTSSEGVNSDDGFSEDITGIQNSVGDYTGTRGAVASLKQRFDSPPPEEAPPKPPPREFFSSDPVPPCKPIDQTKVRDSFQLSSYSGVRLREQFHPIGGGDKTNGNVNFYAEQENNNAYTENFKLSPNTLQSLERNMPRRTRRSVGEDRIRRRNSSDASDSEGEVAKMRTERGWSTSSRTSEGDSSSDETFASSRLSTSSNERHSFTEKSATSAYKSPPRPLYDLPEDQTNRTCNQQQHQHHHHSQEDRNMEQTPPPLPPRDTTASVYRRPPDRTRPSDQPPPLPEKPSVYDRLTRSRTTDASDVNRDNTSNYYMNYSNYDVLPARNRTPVKSHSLDVIDVGDNYLRGSSASIRQLLKQSSSFDSGLNDNVCIDDDDDIDDMPDTSPPPVPTNRKSFVDSTYSEIPLVARSRASQLVKEVASQPPLIREAEYVLMKPQTESDVQREYERLSSESDYILPSNSARSTQKPSPKPKLITSTDCKTSSDIHPAYQIMHPSSPSNHLPSHEPSFTRTKSAHLQSRPAYLSTTKIEQRRGTVAQSMGLSGRDGCSSLPRSDQNKHGRGQSRARMTRRSRSFDDLLQDDDWHMPHEAESLNDLLARAYISPKVQPSSNTSEYLVPPSVRRQQPPPLPPTPEGHSFSRTPSSSSSRSDQYSEAAYLDMTQSSLERVKTKKKQDQPVSIPSPDTTSPPPLPKKYILYDPNDDLVDL